ncbi:MAG TPA: hypothetical protein VF621_01985 [Pyrinomonadaceae bacterium]
MRVSHSAVSNFLLAALLVPAAGSLSGALSQTPERGRQSPATASPAPPRQGATPAAREPRTPLESEADAAADVSITARVTADSLRFERVPNPRVEFTGRPRRETAWESERENLPQQVRPGETYRNVGITLHIRSVFADIDRIVAEALGEVPPSDGAPPTPARPQPPGTNTPPAESTTPPSQAPAGDTAVARQRRGVTRRGRGS